MDHPNDSVTPTTPLLPKSHLLGSKAADVVAGIVASLLWWAAAVGVSFACQRNPAPGLLVVGVIFLLQVTVVGIRVRGSGAFVTTQIVTAVLLPVLAFGLLFGACLLGGMKF